MRKPPYERRINTLSLARPHDAKKKCLGFRLNPSKYGTQCYPKPRPRGRGAYELARLGCNEVTN